MALVSIGGLPLYGTDDAGCSWLVENLTGWGKVGTTLGVDQKGGADGGFPSQSYKKPRVVGVDGGIVGPSTAAVLAAYDNLCAALEGSPVLSVDDGLGARTAVVGQQDPMEPVWINGQSLNFSFQAVAADSRKLGTPVTLSTALPSVTGGLTYSVTYPRIYTAVQVTGVVTINNPGKAAGPMQLRISGPVTGPSVTHLSSGLTLTFASNLTLNAGEWLDIDMDNHKVLANGQSSRNNTVTSRGWFLLDPGSNQFGFNAVAYNSGAQLTVTGTPAWL